MSRKILSVALAFILVAGFGSFMTKADVTGSFKATVVIQPVPCGSLAGVTFPEGTSLPVTCEDTFQKSDFEAAMNINWTISGLTLGFNTVVGFAGLEHILTNLQATLGALNIKDQFFFAVPFGTDTITFSNDAGTQTHSELAYTVINPNLFFVKKRVTASISIAGITLTNLALLEDVNFPKALPWLPYPYPIISGYGPIGGQTLNRYGCWSAGSTGWFANGHRCYWLPSQAAYAGYNAASQAFRFGDTITVEGQTVSGITVRNITGIGMDPQLVESFKKIQFAGVVCDNTNLGFAVEKIQVEGIPVGPITWNEALEFRFMPQDTPCVGKYVNPAPFGAIHDFTFSSPFGDIELLAASTDLTKALFGFAVLTVSSGGITIDQYFDNNLEMAFTELTLRTTLNPDSNPASLKVIVDVCQQDSDPFYACDGKGLNWLQVDLTVKRQMLTFKTSTVFAGPNPTALYRQRFTLSAQAGPLDLSLKAQLHGTPLKFDRIEGTVGVNF